MVGMHFMEIQGVVINPLNMTHARPALNQPATLEVFLVTREVRRHLSRLARGHVPIPARRSPPA
jgi:hypothetical protein